MTDVYGLLRGGLSEWASDALRQPIRPAHIDCSARWIQIDNAHIHPCVIRSAAPLLFGEDAACWATQLHALRSGLIIQGVQALHAVEHSGEHLLFTLTDAFYSMALRLAIAELPPLSGKDAYHHAHPVLCRILYARRRMWMLSRKAKPGNPIACPAVPDVQMALYLSFAAAEHPELSAQPRCALNARALELRLLRASDALLHMLRSAPPRERAVAHAAAAYAADGAGRLLTHGLQRILTLEQHS